MLKKLWSYHFPKPRPQSRLPLLSRRYSSEYSATGAPPPELRETYAVLKALNLARTDADAWRVLLRHPGEPLTKIIKIEQRIRRPEGMIAKGWRRHKLLWRRNP